jgi:hypothetical protein
MSWPAKHRLLALLLIACATTGYTGAAPLVHRGCGLALLGLCLWLTLRQGRHLLRLPAGVLPRLAGWFARVGLVVLPVVGVAGLFLLLAPSDLLRVRALLVHRAFAEIALPALAGHAALTVVLRLVRSRRAGPEPAPPAT